MKSLVIMPRAEADLDEIRAYSTRHWGVANWETRARLFQEAFGAVLERPEGGQDRNELVAGMRSRLVKPHIVFFIERPDAVVILRVVDGRRDLPNLKFSSK